MDHRCIRSIICMRRHLAYCAQKHGDPVTKTIHFARYSSGRICPILKFLASRGTYSTSRLQHAPAVPPCPRASLPPHPCVAYPRARHRPPTCALPALPAHAWPVTACLARSLHQPRSFGSWPAGRLACPRPSRPH